jgi:hypothetical protein
VSIPFRYRSNHAVTIGNQSSRAQSGSTAGCWFGLACSHWPNNPTWGVVSGIRSNIPATPIGWTLRSARPCTYSVAALMFGAPLRYSRARHHGVMSPVTLAELAKTSGWQSVFSAYCCPDGWAPGVALVRAYPAFPVAANAVYGTPSMKFHSY